MVNESESDSASARHGESQEGPLPRSAAEIRSVVQRLAFANVDRNADAQVEGDAAIVAAALLRLCHAMGAPALGPTSTYATDHIPTLGGRFKPWTFSPEDVFALAIRRVKCEQCGYLLRGLGVTGRCPECGTQFAGNAMEAADFQSALALELGIKREAIEWMTPFAAQMERIGEAIRASKDAKGK